MTLENDDELVVMKQTHHWICKRMFTLLVRQARDYCVCQTNAYEYQIPDGQYSIIWCW